MSGGTWNRAGRRSGGSPAAKILVARTARPGPLRSIQCHQERHVECLGTCKPFFQAPCECDCHKEGEEHGGK